MSLIYLKSNLKLIWYGIYIKEIKSFFGDNQNILLNKTQLQMGKEISNEKKRLILDVYNMFGPKNKRINFFRRLTYKSHI